MSRRHGTSLKILLAVAVGGLFVYGMYSYHDVHTRLKRSEEKGDRLHQQHDSLSAQLQVVYEHKSRLEKSLQQEKSDHRKSRTELMHQQASMESKYMGEKQELLNRINSINQEHKMLKSQHEDLETEFSKLTEQKSKLEEDHRKLTEQHNIEYQQLQQERNNDVASLRDKIANLQRKNDELDKQLAVALQNYQMNQAGNKQGGLPVPGQVLQQQQEHQQQQQQQQQAQQLQPLQRNNLEQQPAGGQPLHGQNADGGQAGNQNKPQDQDQVQMQIRQPGDNQHPGYHQVKEPEGHGQQKFDLQVEGHAAQPVLDGEHKDVQLQQVRAPNMSPEKIGRKFLRRFRNGLVQSTENVQEQKPPQLRIQNTNLGVGTARKTGQEGRALAINAPEGVKEGQRVENKQRGVGPAAHGQGHLEIQRDDSNKAKQDDRDLDLNDPQAGVHQQDGNFQMREPNVDQDRLNLANPHDDQNRGPFGDKAADKDQIHAPVQPNVLGQPDGQLQVPIIDHQVHANEGGQVERPNLMLPMVNNMNQENQVPVPKAPKLKDNDLLMKGQQVNDDDDYDTDNRNGRRVKG